MDVGTLIAAGIGGVPAIVAATFAFRSSVRATKATEAANNLAATKVDAEAYERSQAFYEKTLTEAEKQIDRLRSQIDRLTTQLAQEQDVSNVLRNQVRTLATQIGSLEATLNSLRVQLDTMAAHR